MIIQSDGVDTAPRTSMPGASSTTVAATVDTLTPNTHRVGNATAADRTAGLGREHTPLACREPLVVGQLGGGYDSDAAQGDVDLASSAVAKVHERERHGAISQVRGERPASDGADVMQTKCSVIRFANRF